MGGWHRVQGVACLTPCAEPRYTVRFRCGSLAKRRHKPRESLAGACVVTTSTYAERVAAHAKGHAPAKHSGVLLLAVAELDDVASDNSRKRDKRPDGFSVMRSPVRSPSQWGARIASGMAVVQARRCNRCRGSGKQDAKQLAQG